MAQTRLIVAGMPRTGTSWLARALSMAGGMTYFREPDNFDHVAGAEERFTRLYLPAGADDPAFRVHMDKALTGRIATTFTLKQDPGPLLGRLPQRFRRWGDRFPWLFMCRPTCLVKLVTCNLALEWLEQRFPGARQVYVVRHPCGQFASWRARGWEPNPALLLSDERLMDEHLSSFAGVIERAGDFWEKAGAAWGAVNKVVYDQTRNSLVRTLVSFEWLCGDAVKHYRELYERLGLPWTEAAAAFLEDMDTADSRPYSMRRQTSSEPAKWLKSLSSEDIDKCRRFAEPFGLPFYPNFAPEAFDPVASPQGRPQG